MLEEPVLKNCIQCANDIPFNASFCTHCNSHQGWRRYINFSTSVLALLVALITVSAQLIPSLKSPKSNIQIIQAMGQANNNPETNRPYRSRRVGGYNFYVTIANLGDKPALIREIEPLKIDDNHILSFSFSPNDAYHSPGTRRIRIEPKIKINKSYQHLSNGTDMFVEHIKSTTSQANKEYKLIFKISNFDDSIDNVHVKLAGQDLVKFAEEFSLDCVIIRNLRAKVRKASDLDSTALAYRVVSCIPLLKNMTGPKSKDEW